MNDLISGFDSPYEEWVVAGRKLVKENPKATLWDLIACMYEYKTGCEMLEIPEEASIVGKHMHGWSKAGIAKELDCTTHEVDDILTSIGFRAFRKSPKFSPFEVEDMLGDKYGKQELSKLSRFMLSRCKRELKVYKEYKNERGRTSNSDS